MRGSKAAAIIMLCLLGAAVTGCLGETPVNIDWATPTSIGTLEGANNAAIQDTLDRYSQALVAKDRAGFAATLDPQNPGYAAGELERFDRLADVPFSQYRIELLGQTEPAPDTATAKVASGFTLKDSFADLPDLQRSAFYLVRRDDGWKLTGDASEQALGKKSDARFEDFGKIEVLNGEHSLVFYHAGNRGVAEQALSQVDAATGRLEEVIPDANLPKVAVYVYGVKSEIDRAYPGKWQEWTGGASRQLGQNAGQGGEIIIDAGVFSNTARTDPAYNPQMLAHELTHIALFPKEGSRTPPFLIEGLADYVAGINDLTLLKQRLRAGAALSPTLRDIYQPGSFTALLSTEAAGLAYEEADSAVALLEKKYGNERVLALLREFKRREDDTGSQDTLVDEVFRSTLGEGWNEFENEWRQYAPGA